MPITDLFMAALGIVMGALIVRHRADYARWLAGLVPTSLGSELPLKMFFLVIGLGMNAGSVVVLMGYRL